MRNLLATTRLVTLAGMGGVGKTRLALRIAENLRKKFADDVWIVELDSVSDPRLLVEVIASTVGLREEDEQPLQEVVIDFLSTRKCLLVLDSCERLVDHVANLVGTWLLVCPDLRVIATSREPLDISGEAVRLVPPLSVPDHEKSVTRNGISQYDAVTLFVDRAAVVVPGFTLSEDENSTVAKICARLDGLPLAIELAAARIRTMSPAQILQRLDDRYALLTRNRRTAPTRQQTLRLCIDWSFDLCSLEEQQVWAHLSVFTGVFGYDAAEAVCGDAYSSSGFLDIVSSLVDKSILIRDSNGSTVRFHMLETIRQYGREVLRRSGGDIEVRRKHAGWYEKISIELEERWISSLQSLCIFELKNDLPDIREAIEFCLSQISREDVDVGLIIASRLLPFWNFQSLHREALHWICCTLSIAHGVSSQSRIQALHAGAFISTLMRDRSSVDSMISQLHAVVDQYPDPENKALVRYCDGFAAFYFGSLPDAVAELDSAAEELKGDASRIWTYLSAVMQLGWSHVLLGDVNRGIELYEQVLAVTETCGESNLHSTALWAKGVALYLQSDVDRAQDYIKESLRVNRGVRSPVVAALCIETLAWSVDDNRSSDRSAVLLGAAEGIWRHVVAGMYPDLSPRHAECESKARSRLGVQGFEVAFQRGKAMTLDSAVTYALGEKPRSGAVSSGETVLTNRERQVANLVAEGLTDKQIAEKLIISPRTVQGHVEHVLTKLGFSTRTQIAAWVVGEARHPPS
ncbi:hypothetical protein GS500_23405 [Rhodococcus hoagii]|nr:hypothetical protein [Prescottella equi]